MSDLNKEALDVWGALKPMIDQEISSRTQGMVQRRKAKVTTAPSLSTGTIGVTEPFGTEYFIPFNTNLTTASVGDFVWVEFMYGATNAFASMYASADTKDYTVGGNLAVIGNETVNGDTTLNGVLDVTNRRCYAALSSAGWYRVMKLTGINTSEANGAGGFIVDFNIVRNYETANNEAHKISLMATLGNIKFINEQSVSNAFGITKIRTTNSGLNLYVDVYYGLSTQNAVTVSFNVTCKGGDGIKFNSQPLTNVADSPSGETVLAEYGFIGTSGQRNTFTPAYGTAALGGCWYARNGEYVTVHVSLTGITANTNHIIGTLPVGYRPVSQCCASGSSQTYEQQAHLYVRENGNIDVWSPNTMASLDATFMWR